MATFFGTISPITMCATTTMTSEIVNATGASTASGSPSHANGRSMRWATAGSPRRPSSSELIVMPSWAAASMRERSALAFSTAAAPEVPARAMVSSRSRRAEISANSAPTKNALASSRRTAAPRASKSLLTADLAGRCGNGRGEPQLRHPVAVAAGHREVPAVDLDVVADVGDAAQPGQHHARERLVLALGHRESGGVDHLVVAQQPGHEPAPGAERSAAGLLARVVLVAHVADDLLDEVLQRDDARRPAVLVDDDGE